MGALDQFLQDDKALLSEFNRLHPLMQAVVAWQTKWHHSAHAHQVEPVRPGAELEARAVEGAEALVGHTAHRPYVDAVRIACAGCIETTLRTAAIAPTSAEATLTANAPNRITGLRANSNDGKRKNRS